MAMQCSRKHVAECAKTKNQTAVAFCSFCKSYLLLSFFIEPIFAWPAWHDLSVSRGQCFIQHCWVCCQRLSQSTRTHPCISLCDILVYHTAEAQHAAPPQATRKWPCLQVLPTYSVRTLYIQGLPQNVFCSTSWNASTDATAATVVHSLLP